MSQDPMVGRFLGPYQLLGRIGQGGMGVVYEAIHTQLLVSYAIKILHPTLTRDQMMVARLRREATVALQLQHENIVQVLDYGWDDELGFYLVMELLRGQDLNDLLRAQPILPLRRIANIIYQTCDALMLAHHRGIVHRDMKPGNIFLVPQADGTERVKLLDFGIARLLVDGDNEQMQLTRAGKSFGTPEYMPPEQIRAQRDKIGPATDIYGLCVVIFRMLSGRLPFQSKNLIDLVNQVMLQPPPMISRYCPRLGGTDLERLLFVCLAKNPANRVQPMEVFMMQFQAAMENDLRLALLLEEEDLDKLQSRQVELTTNPPSTFNLEPDTGDSTHLLKSDHHGFREGQTFVFGGETFSFDGQRLRASTSELQQWARTSEHSNSQIDLPEVYPSAQAADMALNYLQSLVGDDTAVIPQGGRLPPPPPLRPYAGEEEDTMKASAAVIQSILDMGLEKVKEKLPPSNNLDLTLAPKMFHRRPASENDVGLPISDLSPEVAEAVREVLWAEGQRFQPPWKARLMRVVWGFLLGFLLIGVSIGAMRWLSPDWLQQTPPPGTCCTLQIQSSPPDVQVIEQGKLLGRTPLTVKREYKKGLQFVLMHPQYELATGSWRARRNRTMRIVLRRK